MKVDYGGSCFLCVDILPATFNHRNVVSFSGVLHVVSSLLLLSYLVLVCLSRIPYED
jgi:hypothetical protein